MESSILDRFSTLTKDFQVVDAQVKGLEKLSSDATKEITSLTYDASVLEKTAEALKVVFESIKKQSIDSVESLVTHALNSVFEDVYDFKITSHERGAASTNRFTLLKNGHESDIMEGHGGGVVNIIAFILRLIFTLKVKPELKPLLVLDEPFVYVSPDLHEKVGKLLRELVDQLGVTIIMVTHQPILKECADRVYELQVTPKGVTSKEIISGSSR